MFRAAFGMLPTEVMDLPDAVFWEYHRFAAQQLTNTWPRFGSGGGEISRGSHNVSNDTVDNDALAEAVARLKRERGVDKIPLADALGAIGHGAKNR